MEVKQFKTIDEQINILKNRGCIIQDYEFSYTILMHVNYYRFTSYFLPFKINENNYKEGTNFNQVYKNYLFDRKLRNMLSFLIEDVEIMTKTKIAYFHSKKYGPLGYLSKDNYNNLFDIDELKQRIEKYITRNDKNPIIKHHLNKYDGNFPLWTIIEFFDFSDISKMYSQLDTALSKEIALSFNTNYSCLASWLYCLTHLRNCCAHYARIYNTKMISIPETPKNNEMRFTTSIFSYLLVLKELLKNTQDWNHFIIELNALIEEYKSDIVLGRMGFPRDWQNRLEK